MSIGLKGTMKALCNFPAIICTSTFSIWTIAPSCYHSCSTCCCNSQQKLGVSFTLTWMNLLLTIVCGQAYLMLFLLDGFFWNRSLSKVDDFGWITILIYDIFYILPVCGFTIILFIFLQCSTLCQRSPAPGSCCDTYCCPVIELTYLDVNNLDTIVTQDNIELDQI